MKRYNPKTIEPKWQEIWRKEGIYRAIDFSSKPKYVMLCEFPYPSGAGMHIGHIREYTLGDIMARQKRMQGYNVLFPMGYDAFGLPTENYAIKNKISPQKATEVNVANYQKQLESLGFSFDWSRSFKTSDPDYYRWTQWLFLRFFEAGLAYQEKVSVNWCPFCKTGLANEEVVNGRHERCDTLVEKKLLKQWLLRITDYADRLINGLAEVDYPSRIADQQINWIGRSVGAKIEFKLDNKINQSVSVFTTRPDTIYGATFLVLAPEHPLVSQLTTLTQKEEVNNYIKLALSKSEIDRQNTDLEKSGVFSGAYAINPASGQKIPIWIADYVLMGYGTGAIMAVPAHDQRDFDFASKYNLPIRYVVEPLFGQPKAKQRIKQAIVAVLLNPKTKQVLMLDWGPRQKNSCGRLFIGGGIESVEDAITAAKREITEETGYLNMKLIQQVPYLVHNHYYSNVKQANYYAQTQGLLFELVDEVKQQIKLDEQEKDKFSTIWVDLNEVAHLVDDSAHKQIFTALTSNLVYSGEGVMVNSGAYDGMNSSAVRETIVTDLASKGLAREQINYRLRDWIFSRQHYWGEPIPIIHCPKHGAVAVPDKDLPVKLPDVDNYEPTNNAESPLSLIDDWVNTVCPQCGEPARRETDTMPNWAGSSWYYLRYFDPTNDQQFAARDKLDYWGMVDLYLGGMEHTTLHLLYSRFWHQFLYDQGLVPAKEPYAARRGQGIVLAADGTKMSKSKGNIVNPSEIIDSGYGADALRLAITFLAPFDQTTPWSPESLGGTFRFLQRIWTMVQEFNDHDGGGQESDELKRAVNKTIKKVSQDLLSMSFNTAVASLMDLVNQLYLIKASDDYSSVEWQWALETLLALLSPFAPHIAEELWEQLGNDSSIQLISWPVHDEQYVVDDQVTIVIQINGKLRSQIILKPDCDQATVEASALNDPVVIKYIGSNKIKRTVFVKDKLINFVL